MRNLLLAATALLALPTLASCEKRDATVEKGWVRLSSVPDSPSAAYFELKGGSDDNRLTGVSSPVVIRMEMHETVSEGGKTAMRAVDGVDVPAGKTVKFEPGGKHVMMWNINPGIKPGTRMPMVFTFANGLQLEYPMDVRGPDGAPAAAPAAAAPAEEADPSRMANHN